MGCVGERLGRSIQTQRGRAVKLLAGSGKGGHGYYTKGVKWMIIEYIDCFRRRPAR
jgi:hypothetical protein